MLNKAYVVKKKIVLEYQMILRKYTKQIFTLMTVLLYDKSKRA